MTQAKFISIEGIEGAGKTTAVTVIQAWLKEQSIAHVLTREPGGTPIAEAIRHVLLHGADGEVMSPDTELLLMFAGRAQNISQVIRPALQRGETVISDRFTDASFAYQGGGRGVDATHICALSKWVQGDLAPDLTFLLDVPVDVGISRIHSRGAKDRIEEEGCDFFERVRAAYLAQAKADPKRFRIIDATQPLETIHAQLIAALEALYVETIRE